MSSFVLDGQEFTLQTKLGSGTQGDTYLYSNNGQLYTVKVVKGIVATRARENFERESSILGKLKDTCDINAYPCLRSTFIVNENDIHFLHFKGIRNGGPLAVMIYNFVPGIPFSDLVNGDGFEIDLVETFLDQILPTVKYLHQNNIIHRDIKPANIIYNRDTNKFTLIDFGLSCQDTCEGIAGTPNFILPSIMKGEYPKNINININKESDVYSVGTVLYMYINKRIPFNLRKRNGDYLYEDFGGWSVSIPTGIQVIIEDIILHPGQGIAGIYEFWTMLRCQ